MLRDACYDDEKHSSPHYPEVMFFIYIPVLSISGYSVPSLTSRGASRRVSGNPPFREGTNTCICCKIAVKIKTAVDKKL